MELSFNKQLQQVCKEKNNYLCIGLDIDPDKFIKGRDTSINGIYEFVLIMAISGGVLSILLILFRKLTLSPVLKRIYWINQLHSNKNQIPYGLAIAFGALVTFDQFPIFKYINN